MAFQAVVEPPAEGMSASSPPEIRRSMERSGSLVTKTPRRLARQSSMRENFHLMFWQEAWNQLDVDEESELSHENDVEDLLEKLAERRKTFISEAAQKALDKRLSVGPNYIGPHIEFPLKLETVVKMVEFFNHGGLLHYKYALLIVEEIRKMYESAPNITDLEVPGPPGEGKLTVVGDLHGQWWDLYTIFRHNDYPSPTNHYLFNGDFVDRGTQSMEILLTIYAFKILYPNAVHVNRGNHEVRRLNERYGFEDEVCKKYDGKLFEHIQNSFCALPICAIIEDTIFVVHGGLYEQDNVTLDDIRLIDRHCQIPAPSKIKDDSMRLFNDLLWSDPRDGIEGHVPSKRGAGVFFGVDITDRFLTENNLELIIRSHEVADQGYEIKHEGKIITLFSASNYCGTVSNLGAFAVLRHTHDGLLTPEFCQFEAMDASAEETGGNAGNKKDVTPEERMQQQAMQKLQERIYRRRAELLRFFSDLDRNKVGLISRDQWASTLNHVLKLDIPWLKLQQYFVDEESNGMIKYAKFLSRYQVQSSAKMKRVQEFVAEIICSKIYENSGDLRAEFRKYDSNADGCISYDEFVDAIRGLDLGLADEHIYDLMTSIDRDQSNSINCDEFLARFQVVFDGIREEKEIEFLRATSRDVALLVNKNWSSVRAAFLEFKGSSEDDRDALKHGLTYGDFTKALVKLGVRLSPEQCLALAKFVDSDNSGHISLKEFRKAFKIVDKKAAIWQDSLMSNVYTVIYENREFLHRTFRAMDIEGVGHVSPNDFREAFVMLNGTLKSPLSKHELDSVYQLVAVDVQKRGYIRYLNFLKVFRLVDTNKSASDESPRASSPDNAAAGGKDRLSSGEKKDKKEKRSKKEKKPKRDDERRAAAPASGPGFAPSNQLSAGSKPSGSPPKANAAEASPLYDSDESEDEVTDNGFLDDSEYASD